MEMRDDHSPWGAGRSRGREGSEVSPTSIPSSLGCRRRTCGIDDSYAVAMALGGAPGRLLGREQLEQQLSEQLLGREGSEVSPTSIPSSLGCSRRTCGIDDSCAVAMALGGAPGRLLGREQLEKQLSEQLLAKGAH